MSAIARFAPSIPNASWGSKIWSGNYKFAFGCDCQFGFFKRGSWDQEMVNLRSTIKKVNNIIPAFFAIGGDITQENPGQDLYDKEVFDFKKIVKEELDPRIPLVILPGNHDVGNTPTVESIKAYESNFGPHYFSLWHGGVHFLAPDSSLICDPSGAKEEYLKQNKWINDELESSNLSNPKHRVILTHHSWCLKDPNEEDNHFVIPKIERLKNLALFQEKSPICGKTICFSGHAHDEYSAWYNNIELNTTGPIGRPLGKAPSGVRIVEVFEDTIKHQYIPI